MSDNEVHQSSSGEESYSSSDEEYSSGTGADMMTKHEFETLKEKWTTMTNKGEHLYSNLLMMIESLIKTDRNDEEAVKYALETLGNFRFESYSLGSTEAELEWAEPSRDDDPKKIRRKLQCLDEEYQDFDDSMNKISPPRTQNFTTFPKLD